MLSGSRAARSATRLLVFCSKHSLDECSLPPAFLCPSLVTSVILADSDRSTDHVSQQQQRRRPDLQSFPPPSPSSSKRKIKYPSSKRCRSFPLDHPLFSGQATSSCLRIASRARLATTKHIPAITSYATASASQFQHNHEHNDSPFSSAYEHLDQSKQTTSESRGMGSSSSRYQSSAAGLDSQTSGSNDFYVDAYSPTLSKDGPLPSNPPPLYQDDIRGDLPWSCPTSWQLSVSDHYPNKKTLFLILDAFMDTDKNIKHMENLTFFQEALSIARQTIWSKPSDRPWTSEEKNVALYVVGKAAEIFCRMDSQAALDNVMTLLKFCKQKIGPFPLEGFHSLSSILGNQARYGAVLDMFTIALDHHHNQTDADMLHFRLHVLIMQGDFEKIQRYWQQFSQFQSDPIHVARRTFDLLLRTHVQRHDFDQVNQVIQAMSKFGYQLDTKAWLTMLGGHQPLRPKLAVMLEKDQKLAVQPNLKLINELLRICAKENDLDSIFMIFKVFHFPLDPYFADQLDSAPTLPIYIESLPSADAETYTICSQLFGRLGRPKESLLFFISAVEVVKREQAACGHTGNPRKLRLDGSLVPLEKLHQEDRDATEENLQRAVTSVIQAFNHVNQPHNALVFASKVLNIPLMFQEEFTATELFQQIPHSLPPISVSTLHYKALLECSASMLSIDVARSILVDLYSRELFVNGRVRRGLARLVFSTVNRDSYHMVTAFRRLIPQPPKPLDGKSTLPDKENVKHERLLKIATLLESLGLSDRVALSSLKSSGFHSKVSRLDQGDEKDMQQWMMKNNRLDPSIQSLKSHTEESVDQNNLDLSTPLTSAGYAMRMRVYAVVRRDYETAEAMYQAMVKHGIRPNMMHIAPLVEGLVLAGRIADAKRLKENARVLLGVAPTLRIYTSLIHAYAMMGHKKSIKQELQDMKQSRLEPDEAMVQIIETATSRRKPNRVIPRKVDLTNLHSVSSRFKVLLRSKRYLEAHQLVQQALQNGLETDNLVRDQCRRSIYSLKKLIQQTLPPRHHEKFNNQDQDEYEKALQIATSNLEIIRHDRKTRILNKIITMRKFRRQVVNIVLDIADGTLQKQGNQLGILRWLIHTFATAR